MKRGRRRREDETKSVANLPTQKHSTSTSVDIKPSTFFKLMLSPTSQSYKLRLPEKFATEYNEELGTSSIVGLMVPTGETWKVTLTKEDNKLWFHDGWHDFVENYSIDYGYFMMFIYEGNLRFSVHVFDLTTCEISYHGKKESCHDRSGQVQVIPYKRKTSDGDDDDEEDDDEDHGDGDEDDNDDDDDTDFQCLGSDLSSSNDHPDAHAVKSDGGNGYDDDEDHHSSETRVGKRRTSRKSTTCVRSNQKGLMKVVIAAGISMPKTSFFLVEIKAYNLCRSLYLNLPMAFARGFLKCTHDDSKDIELEAIDGRLWEVKCIIHGSKSMIGRGWTTFVREIGLEVGDVCVFEVISSRPDVLKVQIAKKSQIKSAELNI
ncbi:hypothetical protein vseg_014044 [Gypsophila vaccaria]